MRRSAARPSRLQMTIGCAAVLLTAVAALAFPKPAAVPYRWELEFQPGPLRLYVDRVSGDAYWFFTYRVENRTRKTQIWAPNLVLFTDAGEILESGRGVPSRVEEGLRDLLGDPLLETQNEIIGEIYAGRDHARDGLAIWPASAATITELSLFVGGLSGETARVRNPVTAEEVILRKTLKRDYLIPGDPRARGTQPVDLVSQQWVLR